MIYPSIEELSGKRLNRYELVIATAKCARELTEIQNIKKDDFENQAQSLKDYPAEKNLSKKDLEDEKTVKLAIQKIHNGEYVVKKR